MAFSFLALSPPFFKIFRHLNFYTPKLGIIKVLEVLPFVRKKKKKKKKNKKKKKKKKKNTKKKKHWVLDFCLPSEKYFFKGVIC